jgi:putative ABC transport system ATP-binding protein
MSAPEPAVLAEGLVFGHGSVLRWTLGDWRWDAGLAGLQGPSGSGKSTLLSTLAGLLPLQGGRLFVDGQALHGLSAAQRARLRARTVALVPQEPALISWMSVYENVRLHGVLGGSGAGAERVRTVLDSLDLAPLAVRRAAELSGGERQRVGLARALCSGARLILADEPTAGLDAVRGQAAVELLRAWADQPGRAVVLASHDSAALDVCSQVLDVEALRRGP